MVLQPRTQRKRLQKSVQPVEVIDNAPMATALLHPQLPRFQPREVLAGIEVVRAKLRHIECDHVEPAELERNVAIEPLARSAFISEKIRISLRAVCFSFRNSIACSNPPVMSV